jgi:hypothetical protein
MKASRSDLMDVLEGVLLIGAKHAFKCVTRNFTVKATMRGKPRKNARTNTILITFDSPNYQERQFMRRKTELPAGIIMKGLPE